MSDHLIAPHGGSLIAPMAGDGRRAELQRLSRDWPSWDLTPRQTCDLELLLNGGFSPLAGFMGRKDYASVCASMRLADGTLWPIPVTLDVGEEFAASIGPGASIALRDPEGVMLAALHVEEVFRPDRAAEAQAVYGTTDTHHPGVAFLLRESHPCYVAGRLEGVAAPVHYDFRALRLTPAELRVELARLGWTRVIAFQTRNPMHRAHVEMTMRAARAAEASLLLHPVVGATRPGDVDHYTRVRCYQAVLPHYGPLTPLLSLLPLAMRMAGPREAVWHAIIRKNYGCTHFIVGRDHAGPGSDAGGTAFYGPYAAQELLAKHEREIGVRMVPFRTLVYVEDLDDYVPRDKVPEGARVLDLAGTDLRRRLSEGRDLPAWFTYPEVTRELRRTFPVRSRHGFTIFLSGLSGAGKSSIANVLMVKFQEMGGRPVSLLDGDIVRRHLSSELGFSQEHRNINIRRIGYVASEITRNGGIAICAPIAPHDGVRWEVRRMLEGLGGFVLVHVATPLEVCEQRDRKGLYAKARAGLVKEFTGISAPYEVPTNAEVVIDTSNLSIEESAQIVLRYLEKEGYIGASDGRA